MKKNILDEFAVGKENSIYFLSIIIPVYNVELYLNRCVESLTKQREFNQIEVILVDDGSTDLSGNICDRYADTFENILSIHKKNGGLSEARNCGIRYANGQYIAFVDSDDFLSSDYIHDMKALIDEYNPDMICYQYSTEKHVSKYTLRGNKKVQIKNSIDVLDDLLRTKMGNQICLNIYSKNLISEIRFPVGRVYEDIATLYKLIIKAKNIVVIDYTYYIYNLTNTKSITKCSSFKNIQDMYISLNEQIDDLRNYFKQINKNKEILDCYIIDKYIYIYLKLIREVKPTKESIELADEIKKYIIKNDRCNILKHHSYNLKKYIYVKIQIFFENILDKFKTNE